MAKKTGRNGDSEPFKFWPKIECTCPVNMLTAIGLLRGLEIEVNNFLK